MPRHKEFASAREAKEDGENSSFRNKTSSKLNRLNKLNKSAKSSKSSKSIRKKSHISKKYSRQRQPAMLCGYCGPNNILPPGYDYWETRYRCLQKGFGAGKFGEKRKWQAATGRPVDPEYPSVCPRINGNMSRVQNGRARYQNRRRIGTRITRTRSSRSSNSSESSSSYPSDSSDDEPEFENSRNLRKVRSKFISNNRRRGARSSRIRKFSR